MRIVHGLVSVGLTFCCGAALVSAQQLEPAKQLVREVAYNELHDHDGHGNWRYWIKQRLPDGTQLAEQVETREGPVTRVFLRNGRALDEGTQRVELAKLDQLLNSPAEQQSRREAYVEDEKRIGRVLTLLPDAFLFEEAENVNGCRHLRFRPDPAYSPHTMEARFFHGISGDLWVDTRMKRMIKLEGRLQEDINVGFGLLAKVNKGSWFRMERTQVSSTEWKTTALEVHISGRAVMFKALGRETSEMRGGFEPVPASLTLAQGVQLLTTSNALNEEAMTAQFAPASWIRSRR